MNSDYPSLALNESQNHIVVNETISKTCESPTNTSEVPLASDNREHIDSANNDEDKVVSPSDGTELISPSSTGTDCETGSRYEGSYITTNKISDLNLVSHMGTNSKPPYPIGTLIAYALMTHPTKKMTVSDLYKWVMDNFPYYKNSGTTWKDVVRHVLSVNYMFSKVKRDKGEPGRGNYWTVNESLVSFKIHSKTSTVETEKLKPKSRKYPMASKKKAKMKDSYSNNIEPWKNWSDAYSRWWYSNGYNSGQPVQYGYSHPQPPISTPFSVNYSPVTPYHASFQPLSANATTHQTLAHFYPTEPGSANTKFTQLPSTQQ